MDHDRVKISSTPMSCGVFVLSGITDVNGAIYQIASRLYHPSRGEPVAFLIASDVFDDGVETNTSLLFLEMKRRGLLLQKQISQAAENPKTGNTIMVYTGLIDHAVFKAWYSNERTRRVGKVGT
jgi:hypothetical protein